MANIKICDRCKNVFPEHEIGSSCITSGIVYTSEGTRNLAGDMCSKCTSEFTGKPLMIKGRFYQPGELADSEKDEGWQPQ